MYLLTDKLHIFFVSGSYYILLRCVSTKIYSFSGSPFWSEKDSSRCPWSTITLPKWSSIHNKTRIKNILS